MLSINNYNKIKDKIKMKYINKIKSIISNIYNNIKYLCCNNIDIELDIINNIDDRLYNLDNEFNELIILERHDVESIIIDEIGYKENLATHEELIYNRDIINNTIKALKIDIESLDISLNKINEDYKTSSQPYEETYFQFLVDEVIKSIINKLEINENV